MYTPRKDNRRANTLSRRYNVVRKKTNVFIPLLQENKDRLLELSKEVYSILRITYKVLKKLQKRLIKSYYNNLVYKYSSITRTIELI